MQKTLSYTDGSKLTSDTVHFSLSPLLPENHHVVLNTKLHLLSLITEGPRLIAQQRLTDNESRVLHAILQQYPHYCPYAILLISITSPQVTPAAINHWHTRLQTMQREGTWARELRPLRRTLSSLRSRLHVFNLEISTIRELGCHLTSSARVDVAS